MSHNKCKSTRFWEEIFQRSLFAVNRPKSRNPSYSRVVVYVVRSTVSRLD